MAIKAEDKLLGSRIRERRQYFGYSQQKLADALDVTYQQFQKYELGQNKVAATSLVKIAEFLKTDSNKLLGSSESKISPLNKEELALLRYFNKMKPASREIIVKFVKGLQQNGR